MNIGFQELKSIANQGALRIMLCLGLTGALAVGCHVASANSKKLSDEWTQFSFMKDKPLGLLYEWKADDRSRPMHESQIFASLNGNEMAFYYAQEIDPFGGYSRCGGFPCGLQAGSKLGSVIFEKIGTEWRVRKAMGKTSFLIGATCRLMKYNDLGGMQLVCKKASGPYDQDGDRVIEINSSYYFIDPAT